MSTYSLGLTISQSDLATLINAKEQIVLVRRLIDAGVPVAWAVIPLSQSNALNWNDEYQLFATSTPTTVGQTLAMNAAVSAMLQCDYDYSPSGFTGPNPDGSLPAATLQVHNADSNSNAFGLAQGYVRNGATIPPVPLNAQSVPADRKSVV